MGDTIDQLAADYWAGLMNSAPTWAHILGDYSHADRFEEVTRESEDRDIAFLRDVVKRAESIPTEGLEDQQQLTRRILIADATANADLMEARLKEFAADPIFGDQTTLPVVLGMLGVPNEDVADAVVSKFKGIGQYFADLANRQREGAAAGRFSPQFAVEGTIKQLEATLASPAADDPLIKAINVGEDVDGEALARRLEEAIETSIRPGLAAYAEALREVLPHARPDDQCGYSWLPEGDDIYARALRHYTTTDLTAREIHEIGLAQVEKLADEYRALGPAVVGTDDLAAIFEAMRTDPKLHFTEAEPIIEASRVAMEKAWAAMPDWFEVMPKAPCGVEATTTGAKAYYYPPATDGSRGGTFFVNVEEPESWGIFEMESLAYHEGIPGHHLQLAIAAELEGIPEFRKHVHNSAYAEGWGLYTERLADEMGLYADDVQKMGMLSADSMRATRLVVDTGIHALGWGRQQAVDYMVANSPLTEAAVRAEIDRYIIYGGQATSYMIGRLEMLRMRAAAQERQGDRFDIKKFHSAVLDSGSLPLGVLDEVIQVRLP